MYYGCKGEVLKNIDRLLDGTTVLNFPMYFRLFRRYKKMSVAVMCLVLALAMALHFLQRTTYYTSINFSDVASGNPDPAMKMLSAFTGDSKDNQKAHQILGLRKSMDFSRRVATRLMNNEAFLNMRFDLNYFGDNTLKAREIVKKCGGKDECVHRLLVELIPSFYEIFDRDRAGVTFTVEAKASDELTAQVIIKELQESIQEFRISTLKSTIAQQEKTNLEILAIKQKEMQEAQFYQHLEEKDLIDSQLKDINDRIDVHSKIFAEVKSTVASLESRVERSRAVVGKKVGIDQIEREKRRSELKERIEKLNKDLNALEISNFEYSEKDKQVITNLKNELAEKKKTLNRLGHGNGSSSMDSFIKSSEEKINSTELEYKVAKDQYEALNEAYEQYVAEKNELLEKKAKADQVMERLAPTAKFVKELTAKVDQLLMLKTTVVSDMRFDIYPKPPEESKKIGKILIVAYTVLLYGLLAIMTLSIAFLLDDKIYDEDDLIAMDTELKVIGVAPKYD